MNRYFVIHSVSPADGLKMDAAIFGLGMDVGVDHIRNLRLIIQGYLEGAYSYSERDASLLAEYITIYNAVYRGDFDFFSTRYKDAVMENVTKEKAGLSIRFDEWPGQTLMIIPLGLARPGSLSSIDTSAFIDSRVREQLREDPDRGLDTRRDMVNLLERQAEEAAQQASIQREAIREEERRLAIEREETAEQRRQAEEQQRIAEQRIERAQNEQERRLAEEQLRRAEEQQRQAEERQERLDQLEQALDRQRQEVDKAELFADQKVDEAQEERRRIAEDQQSTIAQGIQSPPVGLVGVTILTPGASLGRLVLINPENGQELRRSNLSSVNARSVTLIAGRVIAIAGEARGNGAIRLVEIDRETLEIVMQGNDDISPQSLIWVNGANLYAIVSTGGNSYLACFNTDLVLQSRSTIAVHPYAAVIFTGGFIITQRVDGSAVLLNQDDLTVR
jgi:hypothetical protein